MANYLSKLKPNNAWQYLIKSPILLGNILKAPDLSPWQNYFINGIQSHNQSPWFKPMENYLSKPMQLRRNSQQFSSDTCSKSGSCYFTARIYTNHTFLKASNKEMEIHCSQLSSSTQQSLIYSASHEVTKEWGTIYSNQEKITPGVNEHIYSSLLGQTKQSPYGQKISTISLLQENDHLNCWICHVLFHWKIQRLHPN